MANRSPQPHHLEHAGNAVEVFRAFLQLGLTSFGGPIAHLGYFRTEFVERRQWVDEQRYADLVALCQFLPGPASSQVGMALGWGRAGWRGALAAWLGFTLPSAIALILFALGLAHWTSLSQSGVVHGLKIMTVAVVAQAVWGMAKSLCPDLARRLLAVSATLIVLVLSSTISQITVMLLGALIGWRFLRLPHQGSAKTSSCGLSLSTGIRLLSIFLMLLIGLPIMALLTESEALATVSSFYQAGALVFGGGHVVLPLLQAQVVSTGLVDHDTFMAGYGAAQAVPGPLFTFAGFLGAAMPSPLGGWLGGVLLLIAIFLPSFLLVGGALPYWDTWRQRDDIQRALAGINASVVGILAASLYDPIWTTAIHSSMDVLVTLTAFAMLVIWKISPVSVVAFAMLTGHFLAF